MLLKYKVNDIACTVKAKDCRRKLNTDVLVLVFWSITTRFGAPAAQNTLQLWDHFCVGIGEEQRFSRGTAFKRLCMFWPTCHWYRLPLAHVLILILWLEWLVVSKKVTEFLYFTLLLFFFFPCIKTGKRTKKNKKH